MRRIAICVPLRNEAAALPALFAALDRLEQRPDDAVHCCLFLDGCTDASQDLAYGYRGGREQRVTIEAAEPSPANAGRARHRAVMLGLSALGGDDGLLLTTDADSMPAPTWLTAMAAALEVADVVAGRIVRTGGRPQSIQDRVETYYDTLFALRRRLDPVPWEAKQTHHCTGGANLGFSAYAYRRIGGFAPIACGEDARLVDDAARAGLRVRRDPACVVLTSDRRHGRVDGGLAMALRQLDESDAASVRVAHPGDAAWQYRMHAAARAAYNDGAPCRVAAAIGLSVDHVRGVARDCPNAEAFAMRVVPTAPGGMRSVSLFEAEAELSRLLRPRQAA